MDCSKFSKAALKGMLADASFKSVHAEIQAYLTPKPKDYTPDTGKVEHNLKSSRLKVIAYSKGYAWIKEGGLYKDGAEELINLLQNLIEIGAIVERPKA